MKKYQTGYSGIAKMSILGGIDAESTDESKSNNELYIFIEYDNAESANPNSI